MEHEKGEEYDKIKKRLLDEKVQQIIAESKLPKKNW